MSADQSGQNNDKPSVSDNINFDEIDSCQESLPALLNSLDFDKLISSNKILEPKDNKILYFRIELKSNNGNLNAVYDSGAKSSVFLSKFLQNQSYFANKLVSSAKMEVVGALTKSTDLYQVLLPAHPNSQYTHISCNAFAVSKIISPTTIHDITHVLDEAYSQYRIQCNKKGKKPVSKDQWPKPWHGGNVDCLLGINSLSFKVIFQFHGLIFISHNLSSTQMISVGGQLNTGSDHNSPVLFTGLAEDMDPFPEHAPVDISDEIWPVTTDLVMEEAGEHVADGSVLDKEDHGAGDLVDAQLNLIPRSEEIQEDPKRSSTKSVSDQVKKLSLNDTEMEDTGIASMNSSLVIEDLTSIIKEETSEEWKALIGLDWFEETEKEGDQAIDAPTPTDLIETDPGQVEKEPQKRIILEKRLTVENDEGDVNIPSEHPCPPTNSEKKDDSDASKYPIDALQGLLEELPIPVPALPATQRQEVVEVSAPTASAPPITRKQNKETSSPQIPPKKCPVCKRPNLIRLFNGIFICSPCESFARRSCQDPRIQDCISGRVGGPVGSCIVRFNKRLCPSCRMKAIVEAGYTVKEDSLDVPKRFRCTDCPSIQFKTKEELNKHLEDQHSEIYLA